ncbi:MAG: 50S ribosomal protein L10 [Deltaproteobacteria bacterium]|nr:50S ribosomal protein L10 [Deltaproteobacteria bacterium]
MPLTKAKKADLVTRYEEGLAAAPHAFVLGYQGITVPQVTELRAKVRESGGHYEVVKNTLVLRAIEGKPLGEVKDIFQGTVAVAYCNDDAVGLAKALTEFAKDAPMVEFKAGMVEGKVIEAGQIKDIASLPSREELLAKLLFLLQSPVSRMVRGLAALPRRFVVAMDQVAQKKS